MVMDAESDLGSADLPQDPVIKQQLPLGYKNLNETRENQRKLGPTSGSPQWNSEEGRPRGDGTW